MSKVFSGDSSTPMQHSASSSVEMSRNEAQAREISELRSELASLRLSVSRAKESPFQGHVWDALKTVFLWALVMNLAVLCVNIMKAV